MQRSHSWRETLKNLTELTEILISSGDLSELYALLTERIARITGARGCLIATYDTQKRMFVAQKPDYGVQKKGDREVHYHVTRKMHRLWNFRVNGTLLSNDPSSDPRIDSYFIDNYTVKSVIMAPMIVQNRMIGLIAIMNKRGKFTDFDSYIASLVAYQTGIILTNARLMDEQKKRSEKERKSNNQLMLLSELISEISLIQDRKTIAETTVKKIRERFKYYFVAIGWVDEEKKIIHIENYVPEFDAVHEIDAFEIPFSKGLMGKAVRSGRTVLVSDTTKSEEYYNVLPEVRSELVTPVRVGDSIVAILDLQSDQYNAFDDSDLIIMEILANALSTALQNAESYHRLERINAQLLDTARAKEEIVQIVAHDFRSPLTVIRGYMDYLLSRKEFKDEKQKEVMETVSTQAQRLQKLAEATLKASRLDSGDLSFSFEKLDFNSFVRRLIFPLSDKHKFIVTTGKDLPLVKADSGRLQEVLENLISNAIKYSPEGGQIEVRVEQASKEGLPSDIQILNETYYLKVSVSDEGIGIPTEKKDLLFRRFTRVHDNRKIEGIGLGLYIAKKIIEMHGGRIWAEERNPGACFTFLIPAFKEHPGAQNILIIDDDVHILRLLHRAISELGFDVITAADGKEALDQLYRFKPQLIIVDVIMPGMSGTELVEKLKENPETASIPLIVFTGKSDFHFPEEYKSIPVISKNAGIQALKPFIEKALS